METMTTIGDRIRNRLLVKEKSQDWLAEEVGCSQTAISKLLRGQSERSKFLPDIAKALRVNINWLAFGVDLEQGESATIQAAAVMAWDHPDELGDDKVIIPRYRIACSAGNGKIHFEIQEHAQGEAFRRAWFVQRQIHPEHCVIAIVEGDSMSPALEDGDSVMIDRGTTNIIDRRVYALCLDGEIFIKRLFKAGDNVFVRSDNIKYPEFTVPNTRIEILGRVVWKAGEM
ncbi:helix-turn-helix transcriptional regulator [Acidithiobacillus sp. MC6.1]|nr:helix-turn-helix transcriptional regulator [Acidithiobacillus sp. MC6.1]